MRPADVGRGEHVLRLHLGDERGVHHLVADQVHEAVDAGVDELMGVVEVVDMGQRHQALGVRLLDDRPIEVRGELLDAAVAVVDPDLHRVRPLGLQLAHALTPLLRRGDRERRVGDGRKARPAVGRRHAAAGREQPRRVRRPLALDLERQRAHVGAHAEHRAHAVVGIALEVLHDLVARVDLRPEVHAVEQPDVDVGADQRRHHGLARQIDPRAAGRQRHRAGAADHGNPARFHHERRSLDRRRPIADDQSRAFEQRRRQRRARRRRGRGRCARRRGGDHAASAAAAVGILASRWGPIATALAATGRWLLGYTRERPGAQCHNAAPDHHSSRAT